MLKTLLFLLFSVALLISEPHLHSSFSERNFSDRISRSRGFIPPASNIEPEKLHIVALLVEFKSDSTNNTTGTGLFGFRTDSLKHSFEDARELKWYASDTVYPLDALPHNSDYFRDHLIYLSSYYSRVSRGNLDISWELWPEQADTSELYPEAYQVPLEMARYSPGQRAPYESQLDFSLRITTSLLRFVRDAIVVSDTSASSPFSSLKNCADGHLWHHTETDSSRAAVLIFYAGSSYLTDGAGNSLNRNSPSDLRHSFISEEMIREYYSPRNDTVFNGRVDTLDGRAGFRVTGIDKGVKIPEILMSPATSNQDSLNWGINGILVNQVARQLGVPTLHSRSGFSATGAFCIMDYAGYSAGQGFIPPYPSAFVRTFLGWETPKLVKEGQISLPAVGSAEIGESEIIKVPLTSTEYYLIENRQRNLTDTDYFKYDTTDRVIHISRGHSFDLSKLPLEMNSSGNVILDAPLYDIGIPASGALVWHIDEKVIRTNIAYDQLNMDSSFRAVSLKEADGINDIGIQFVNQMGQRVDDYGGAGDVFPHRNSFSQTKTDRMNALTRPSTSTNDGGNTNISLQFTARDTSRVEKSYFRKRSEGRFDGYSVFNFSSRYIDLSVNNKTKDIPIERLMHRALSADTLSELLTLKSSSGKDIFLIDKRGRLFLVDSRDSLITDSTISFKYPLPITTRGGEILYETKYATDSITPPVANPAAMGDVAIIPSKEGEINFWRRDGRSSIKTDYKLSTTPLVYSDSSWIVGTSCGRALFGRGFDTTSSLLISPASEQNSLSIISNTDSPTFASISSSKMVTIFNQSAKIAQHDLPSHSFGFFPPFSMVTGDLRGDDSLEVVVTDIHQSLAILALSRDLTEITDSYTSAQASSFVNRSRGYTPPENHSSPVLTDISGDGKLDIIIGGTNGVYAFNSRAVLLERWPALLDRQHWSVKKSILTSPVTLAKENDTLTIFGTPTGERVTFSRAKVDSIVPDEVNRGRWKIYYENNFGFTDSSLNHTEGFKDTVINILDSIVIFNNAPGGLVDARGRSAKRPVFIHKTETVDSIRASHWPLSVGSAIRLSPMLVNHSDELSLYAVSEDGVLSRWNIEGANIPIWRMWGGDPQRSFHKSAPPKELTEEQTIGDFFSYPNPVRILNNEERAVRFRYTLNARAENVRLTIYTIDGMRVYDSQNLSTDQGTNEYIFRETATLGSAVYHCRLEVSFEGKTISSFWKMAVMRGTR